MKKFIAIIIIMSCIIMSCTLFTSCGSTNTDELRIQNLLTLYHAGDKVELLNKKLIEEYESYIGECKSNVCTDYIYSIKLTNNDVIISFEKGHETIYKDKDGNTYTESTLPDNISYPEDLRHTYDVSTVYSFYEFSLKKHPDWIRAVKN